MGHLKSKFTTPENHSYQEGPPDNRFIRLIKWTLRGALKGANLRNAFPIQSWGSLIFPMQTFGTPIWVEPT